MVASGAIITEFNNLTGFIVLCILVFLLIPIWTSFYLLEIDIQGKRYLDATVFMGRKYGQWAAYSEMTEIFIKPQGYSQNFHSRSGAVFQSKFTIYESYLKLDGDHKIFLISDESPGELKERLQPYAKKFGIEIRDITQS